MQQQQRPSKLPLVIGVVLIAATIARHRRHAHAAAWRQAPDGAGGPGAGFGRHGHHHRLAARLADCAARMADARDVEYV